MLQVKNVWQSINDRTTLANDGCLTYTGGQSRPRKPGAGGASPFELARKQLSLFIDKLGDIDPQGIGYLSRRYRPPTANPVPPQWQDAATIATDNKHRFIQRSAPPLPGRIAMLRLLRV